MLCKGGTHALKLLSLEITVFAIMLWWKNNKKILTLAMEKSLAVTMEFYLTLRRSICFKLPLLIWLGIISH